MNSALRSKTFFKSLTYYPRDLDTFRTYLGDKRLTQAEKMILKSWLWLRARRFNEVIEKLSQVSSPDPVVESQKYLLLGISYNNMSQSQEALNYLGQSKKLLGTADLKRERFILYSNLFIANFNLKDTNGIKKSFKEFSQLRPFGVPQVLESHRIRLLYYTYTGQLDLAKQSVEYIDKNINHLSDFQKTAFAIAKFVLFIRLDDLNKCEEILRGLSYNRKYCSRANFLFMKKLLAYLRGKLPLYLYANDFKSDPVLFLQVKCLLALESRDLKAAQLEWGKLSSMFPDAYGENFNYQAEKCLFSEVLKKVQAKSSGPEIDTSRKISSKHSQQIFFQMLKEFGGVIPKEELFKRMYGREIVQKEDFNKLACTVKRIKIKHKLKIKSQKGTFVVK